MSDAPAASAEDAPLVFLQGIDRRYRQGDATLEILKGAELAVWAGQSVALVAPSGAGKSTLLHIAGLLEQADAGEVFIDKVATAQLSDAQRTRIRRTAIGFVYQAHHLLPEFSAIENVILPQMIRGLRRKEAASRAFELLSYLGLKDRLTHRPAELSGGEQQRVAIARAVANVPRLLLADEPTGNLDSETSRSIVDLMLAVAAETAAALVVVTHDAAVAERMASTIRILDGRLQGAAPGGPPPGG